MIPKVSIIIPVYNAEKYLHKCLTSAISQTLKDIEIIVINDASTDTSLEIIKEFEKKDSRIQLINFEKNKGNGIGRNTALKKAKGNYILFLDADDWLEKEAAKLVYQKAKKNNYKIVLMGYLQHFQVSQKTQAMPVIYKEKDTNLHRYFLTHTKGFGSMPWAYFYNRKFLIDNNIFFTEGVYFEDVNFVAKAIFSAQEIGALNLPLYHYLVHKESITGFLNKKKIENLFEVHILLKEFLIKQDLFKKYEKEYLICFLIYCIEYSFLGYFKMTKNQRDKELDQFMDAIRKSDVMHLENIAVLKEIAKENKEAYIFLIDTYHFLGTITKYYKLYRFIYKIRYRLFQLFKRPS
jgi:glycosyltransferase involved in cell wall biosynthesis